MKLYGRRGTPLFCGEDVVMDTLPPHHLFYHVHLSFHIFSFSPLFHSLFLSHHLLNLFLSPSLFLHFLIFHLSLPFSIIFSFLLTTCSTISLSTFSHFPSLSTIFHCIFLPPHHLFYHFHLSFNILSFSISLYLFHYL